MDSLIILRILSKYRDEGYTFADASMQLILAGCSSIEALKLLQSRSTEEPEETEEESLEERPEDCICSDYEFEVYGCMCRIRIQPGW